MYKTVIPGLVSVETSLNRINGFVMCQDLNFYPKTAKKYLHHYKLVLDENIVIPKEFDFRSEYYVKKGDNWYFERKISFWNPKFCYNTKTRTLSFNRYSLTFPVKIGGMFTIGEHLSNIIDLNLFLDGYLCMRGISYKMRSRAICLCAPGLNGKTSTLKVAIKKGAKYIAEDYLVINPGKSLVFPTCPLKKEDFWQRRGVDNVLSNLPPNKIEINPQRYHSLFFAKNILSNNINLRKEKVLDSIFLNSLYFLDNLLIRSMVAESNSTSKIIEIVTKLPQKLSSAKTINVNDYQYDKYLNV